MTMNICRNNSMSLFDLLKEDIENVIVYINFHLDFAENKDFEALKSSNKTIKKEERIRVNDKTATGGWY